ncbi:chorismate mutase [Sistotremastrum niveocremeum HHB9708]|uniref:chorismate mutase n=2 Tax=Sistotremastraceae TaxID=3402574 RepID=A0A164NLZ5_9AGAM|nr:chorismate mutase [Sistotremastrum niveocremeum HHB9708]KZT33908.1 chorismate mutase [Sistotremastrum suecicum HHB10207 ss-3]
MKFSSLALFSGCASLAAAAATTASTKPQTVFTVPGLTQIREILALLEAPIISTLVARAALPVDLSLYSSNLTLLEFIAPRELIGELTGRFDYGTLEFPYTLPGPPADKISKVNPFTPGTFHLDKFTPNSNLTVFYTKTLIPLIKAANEALATPASSSSVFFHLNNVTNPDIDSALNLDATLLALLAHRSSIGKIVGETKYASNVTAYTPLIKAKDADSIRVLLTNVAQETSVLTEAAADSFTFAQDWEVAQGATNASTTAFITALQAAAAATYRELIDITTEVEIQYILARLD